MKNSVFPEELAPIVMSTFWVVEGVLGGVVELYGIVLSRGVYSGYLPLG